MRRLLHLFHSLGIALQLVVFLPCLRLAWFRTVFQSLTTAAHLQVNFGLFRFQETFIPVTDVARLVDVTVVTDYLSLCRINTADERNFAQYLLPRLDVSNGEEAKAGDLRRLDL